MTTRYVCISLGHVIIIFTQLTVILLNLMRHFYLIVAWRLMHFNMGRNIWRSYIMIVFESTPSLHHSQASTKGSLWSLTPTLMSRGTRIAESRGAAA